MSRIYTHVTGDVIGLAAAARIAPETAHARLRALFETHHRRLYRLARRMATTADEANDVVQETFLRVARAPASVPVGMPAEEAWLVRVLVNVCRGEWRKRAVRQRLDPQHLADASGHDASSPEAAFVAHATVWAALRQLAPRRRAAIILYELDGVSMAEIARMLGVSAVTVRWHLSRGRRELARIIGKTDES